MEEKKHWLDALTEKLKEAQKAYEQDRMPHFCASPTDISNGADQYKDACSTCNICPFNKYNIQKTLEEVELLKPHLDVLRLIKD